MARIAEASLPTRLPWLSYDGTAATVTAELRPLDSGAIQAQLRLLKLLTVLNMIRLRLGLSDSSESPADSFLRFSKRLMICLPALVDQPAKDEM
jgi:hypothetical protein